MNGIKKRKKQLCVGVCSFKDELFLVSNFHPLLTGCLLVESDWNNAVGALSDYPVKKSVKLFYQEKFGYSRMKYIFSLQNELQFNATE